MLVHDLEGGEQPLASFLVQIADRDTKALDRLDKIVPLGDEPRAARFDLDQFLIGAQIDRAETFALLLEIFELSLDLSELLERIAVLHAGEAGEEMRFGFEIDGDRMKQALATLTRAFDALFRSCARLAGGAHCLERAFRRAVGSAQRGLRRDASVIRRLLRRLGKVDLADQCTAPLQEGRRRVRQRLQFVLRLSTPGREFADLRLGALAALHPGGLLASNRLAAGLARGGFARQGLSRRTRLGASGSRIDRVAARPRELIGGDKTSQSAFGVALASRRLVTRGARTRRRLFERR